ncbi:MAG: LapA family protein, partial [candidate division WOR-3 bacterium]
VVIEGVRFLVWSFDVSLALLVILSVLGGLAVGVLVMLPGLLRRSGQLRRTRKQLEAVDKALEKSRPEPESDRQTAGENG